VSTIGGGVHPVITVLGWVIVCEWVNHLDMQPATQLNFSSVPACLAGVKVGHVDLSQVAGNTV